MVPGELGHLPVYREVTGTPREVYGPYWALSGKEGEGAKEGAPPCWGTLQKIKIFPMVSPRSIYEFI